MLNTKHSSTHIQCNLFLLLNMLLVYIARVCLLTMRTITIQKKLFIIIIIII